jgi:hypothetical protein
MRFLGVLRRRLRVRSVLTRAVRLADGVRRRFAETEILVLGDSHSRVFRHWRFAVAFPRVAFTVCDVGGATASGLANPNSKTQAYSRFREALSGASPDWIVVSLGEVDTGFVIWYRAEKYKAPVDEMLGLAIEKYTEFLRDLHSSHRRIVVVSAPLPTIEDGNTWGEVANQRKEVAASLLERTDLTLRFNKAIERFAHENRVVFVGLDSASLSRNGAVRPELKSRDPLDHHYDQSRYAKLIVRELKRVL